MIFPREFSRLLTLAGGFLAAAAPTGAAEWKDALSYTIGAVTLRPHASVSEQYNDNLFYSSRTKVSDLISIFRPSLEVWLGRPTGENFFTFDYSLESLNYADLSANNSLDHSFGLSGSTRRGRLTTEHQDRVQYLSSIYGGYNSFQQAGTGFSAALDRAIYSLNHAVFYALTEKTKAYVRGTFSATDFEKGLPLYDVNSTQGTVGFLYKGLPKTSFFGEGNYGQMAAGPNLASLAKGPHVDTFGGFLGANGQFTSRLLGTVKVGYQENVFANHSSGPSSPVVEVGLTERFTDRTSVNLNYSRWTALSVQAASQPVTVDHVRVLFRQDLGTAGKWIATVSGAYGFNDYGNSGPYAGRVDDYFGASVGLLYHIRLWLTARAGYELEKVITSDKRALDYMVNRVTVSLAIGY